MIDFIACWLIKGIAGFLNLLPIHVSLAMARGLGWLLAFSQVRAAQAYANIKWAFPGRFRGPEIRNILCANYMSLCQNLVEMMRFPKMNRQYAERYVRIPQVSRFFRTKQAGKGTILLTAHFGNWEFLNIRSCFLGIPIYVLVRDQKFKRLTRYLNYLRESHGSHMIKKGAEMRQILVALRQNEMVGFLGDQQGGKTGVPVRFFGRLTTAPAGPLQIPLRTGAKVLPCFITRDRGPYHTVHVEEEMELVRTGDEARDIQLNTQAYISVLEKFITDYPHQWHWLHKRWKHNWTKQVVILSDGKAGHVNQSKAIYHLLKQFEGEERSTVSEVEASIQSPVTELNALQVPTTTQVVETLRYQFPLKEIEVQYRSKLARKLFPVFSFFMMPFIQGRFDWLRPWLTDETCQALEGSVADIIISCGSSVLPLNFMLKRECLAKNIVLMKPSFPFSFLRSDLNLVPEHDRVKETERVLATRVTPNLIDLDQLALEGEAFRKSLNLKSGKVLGLFLGGKTKDYDFDEAQFSELAAKLDSFITKNDCRLLVTTSRRTDEKFEDELTERFGEHERVPVIVIANRHNPEGIVTKIMAASDLLLVSEDSISMISEGIASSKPVVVLRLGKRRLADKHYRFQERLESQGVLRIASPSELNEVLEEEFHHRKTRMVVDESQKILSKLEGLL